MPFRRFRRIQRLTKMRNELNEIYLSQVMESFAISLIGIFIPIYLLKLGFALDTVFAYLIVAWTSFALLSPLSAIVSSKIGFKHTILFRIPILVLFLVMLIYVGSMSLLLLLLTAFVGSISHSLYWVAFNSEFVKNSDKYHTGEEIGLLTALPKMAGIFAPLIGGAILEFFGFNTLFILVIALIVISVVPLFMSAEHRSSFRFKSYDMKMITDRSSSFSFFMQGIFHATEIVIWPLFIFFTLNDLLLVGLASSISAMGIAILTIIVGRFSDRIDKRKILVMGAVGYSVIWMLRAFPLNLLGICMLSFMGAAFETIVHIPIFTNLCNIARERNTLANVASRETWIGIGSVAVWIPMLIFSVQTFSTVFIITGFLTLLLIFMRFHPVDMQPRNLPIVRRKRKIKAL